MKPKPKSKRIPVSLEVMFFIAVLSNDPKYWKAFKKAVRKV